MFIIFFTPQTIPSASWRSTICFVVRSKKCTCCPSWWVMTEIRRWAAPTRWPSECVAAVKTAWFSRVTSKPSSCPLASAWGRWSQSSPASSYCWVQDSEILHVQCLIIINDALRYWMTYELIHMPYHDSKILKGALDNCGCNCSYFPKFSSLRVVISFKTTITFEKYLYQLSCK